MSLVGQLKVRCRNLAVAAIFELVGELLAIGETRKPSTFDGGNMDKCVLATIIGGDKAEAFCGIEEFYGAVSHG